MSTITPYVSAKDGGVKCIFTKLGNPLLTRLLGIALY